MSARRAGNAVALTGGGVSLFCALRDPVWQLGVVIGLAIVFVGFALRERAIRRDQLEEIDHVLRHVQTFDVGGETVRATSRENAERVAARASHRRRR